MGSRLNILLVEDSEDEALLLEDALLQGGFAPIIERVETEAEMRSALEGQAWDLLLVDYVLPHFSAPAALAVYHSLLLEIPFIVVSGQVNEEVAVDIMRSGAHDYISKQKLARLIPAIERELAEAESRRQRRQAEDELDRLRHYLQNVIDSMPSVLVGVDEEGVITHWNREAEQYSGVGREQAAGRGLEQVIPVLSEQMERVRTAIRENQAQSVERHIHEVGDEHRYADITIFPLVANAAVGAVIRFDDVTERVRMEEMMMQTEKMMSVGGLAAGMAHEINNPLGGMLQGMQNVRRRLSPELLKNREAAKSLGLDLDLVDKYLQQREVYHLMEGIAEAGRRASGIVENMLSFSRKTEPGFSAVEMTSLADTTLELASVDYDLKKRYDFRRIEVVRDYEAALPAVRCVVTEIQQVLLNLLRNAAQALFARVDKEEVARIRLGLHREGGMVRIEVEDNGVGMTETARNRAFEPFFTTRPPGEGTGLGLSVSYFIVCDEHGGEMFVESMPDKGAKFIIKLPLWQESDLRGEDRWPER
ncbi:MAG: ATP-binding protein [Candidatus Sedimenticola sp. (ex Thyasira tokunagai)]